MWCHTHNRRVGLPLHTSIHTFRTSRSLDTLQGRGTVAPRNSGPGSAQAAEGMRGWAVHGPPIYVGPR